MDAEHLRLGHLIEADRPVERDAIHIAVAPAVAGEELRPGQHVAIEAKQSGEAVSVGEFVGVVDPFLAADITVRPGQRFWVYLYPGSITSLRHEWTHPAFPLAEGSAAAPGTVEASRRWLAEFAGENSIGVDELIEGMKDGDGVCFRSEGGRDEAQEKKEQLWWHVEIVTGKRFSPDHREKVWFSCGC